MKQALNLFVLLLVSFSFIIFPIKAAQVTYPNGAKKAMIFSYDDGPVQDKKLVALFNQYKVVGTFNLNAGLLGADAPWMKDFTGEVGKYLSKEEIASVFKGHEIASHSYSHPKLDELEGDALDEQLLQDQKVLSELKGSELKSFAYPFGAYDKATMKAVKKAGFTNARTVKDTHQFVLPVEPMAWHPTVHHKQAMPLIAEYVKLQPEGLTVMMIWGHSWEFDQNKPNNNWQYMEALLEEIAGKEDIWYVSAGEFIDFIQSTEH